MSSPHRQLGQLVSAWRRRRRRVDVSFLSAPPGLQLRTYCCPPPPPPPDSDPLQVHRRKLQLWFSHLPQEEKQFGGSFSPETMHVDPLVVQRTAQDRVDRGGGGGQLSPSPLPPLQSRSVSVEQLFQPPPHGSHGDGSPGGRGLNVLLYGAVGTGKSTVVRKLVLDWCSGTGLNRFKLLLPFSCEDLSHLDRAASLRELVSRKYVHLRRHPLLSGEDEAGARDVLFLFNGMEKMKLDFRVGSTELCSDPDEPLPPAALLVNLLRKYLLPEACILVTTRLSAVDRIPQKYVSRYAQICGFSDPERQRLYFTSRLLQQSGGGGGPGGGAAEALVELLYLNLQRQSQLAAACFLPSYCWLTCATLHFLHFTDGNAPIRTLTGIYTSFLRLNFGGEVLSAAARARAAGSGGDGNNNSLMLYVVRTLGKMAFEGVSQKRTSFSGTDLEQWIGGETKTDEELRQLAVFRTDVLDFFLAPCVDADGGRRFPEALGESEEQRYVFAAPAMQEYLAALYVVLGENKSALEKLSRRVSLAIGQAGDDVSALIAVFSKFIPLRIFAFVFNLLKLFPRLYEKMIDGRNRGAIARTMAAEMFRSEDSYNEDVLDQVEQSLLGVHGPPPQQHGEAPPFELYPIFMGGLLHYGNRALLQQLGCSIQSSTVVQITRALRKHLVRELSQPQPPEEMMDLLVLLYEFQNPRLTAEVLSSMRTIRLSNVRMTSLKCFVLSSVLSCCPASYQLEELDLSSCLLSHELLQILSPAFRHTRSLNLQFNSLGPESCFLLRDLLLQPKSPITSLQLCDNPLLDSGLCRLLEALPGNRGLARLSLMHTGVGDGGARRLALSLRLHPDLQEINVAYNDIGDNAALALVDACREHATVHTLHLYLNPLSDVGKQSLYVRGVPSGGGGSGRRVKVLASVTEGTDLSEDWHPILRVIQENAATWDRTRVQQQLKVFLRDLDWGRRQQLSLWKRLHFRRVESGVRRTLRMLERDKPTPPPSS